jgi:hypothetical protein
MSYDSDYERVYMVEFYSGKFIHVQFFDVEEVKEYCANEYAGEVIKSIHEEVYFNDGEEDDGQPDEQQEWESFDPDC